MNQLQLCVSVEEGQNNKFLTQRRKDRVISENCWGGTQDKNAAKSSALNFMNFPRSDLRLTL